MDDRIDVDEDAEDEALVREARLHLDEPTISLAELLADLGSAGAPRRDPR